jgi:uncharacterized membrane protein YdbT with pleckstrin-like domain
MLTDQNIPPQFESVRDDDENILWLGKPSFIPFLSTGIPFLIIGLLWGAFDYFAFIRHMKKNMPDFFIPFFALHLFPLWGSVLNMARLVLVYNNTSYSITNKRLMMRSGFFGIDFKAVDYDKIEDIQVTVNPLENLFGVGTIRAFSGSVSNRGGRIYDRFIAIANPYEVFKKIKEVSVAIKTDWNYPNALRPPENPGYKTKYDPGK